MNRVLSHVLSENCPFSVYKVYTKIYKMFSKIFNSLIISILNIQHTIYNLQTYNIIIYSDSKL